ncbi:MAG: hypothetical protein PF588_10265 [Candidatus Kapabacteria bacterium]|nr:hypothetical protein [Candidatus Kapabacteria bacterium]
MKLFLIVLIAVFFGSSNLSAFTGNGSGTESDPYQITNVEQL